jgi:putative ABC transport system permease protein
VLVQEVRPESGDGVNTSTANYVDWREQNHVFERMAPMRFVYFNLSDNRAEPERVQALRVTADFFRLIGVKPVLGRLFLQEEEQTRRSRGITHQRILAPALRRRSCDHGQTYHG